MGREKKVVGMIGEARAAEFLKRNGYRILEKNLRTSLGELDIVAKKKGITVFVEIKTRATSSLGPPYLSVTRVKQQHIIRCALAYLKRHNLGDSDWRIDIVSVRLNFDLEVEDIELIENAVEDNY